MSRYRTALLILFASVLFSFQTVFAQSATSLPTTSEEITSFQSDIIVNLENSIDITETIIYNTGPAPHHGLLRNIRTESSSGYSMPITITSITDENGNPYPFDRSNNSNDVVLKIGDPNTTFTGAKTYVIRYHAQHAVDQTESVDELYWNVTGNGWQFPIRHAEAVVTMSSGTTQSQSACYLGASGSTESCGVIENLEAGKTRFVSSRLLSPGEGLTVAVGVKKGVFVPYSKADDVKSWIALYWAAILMFLAPLFLFMIMYRKWKQVGKDPVGKGVIVPQYDVPVGLTPLEVSLIVSETMESRAISAEIIYLAVHGYIKIERIATKVLLFTSADYLLRKLKDDSDLPDEFSRRLMSSLFVGTNESVMISQLSKNFYTKIEKIDELLKASSVAKGYYRNIETENSLESRLKLILTLAPVLIIPALLVVFNPVVEIIIAFVITTLSTLTIFTVMTRLMPSKTEKGVELKEYLLGLKEYLQIAEKDRLAFHNAPEKRPEVFDKLLPYAMVFGVEKAWAKEFEDIYTTPPDWYGGSGASGAFNASVLAGSLSDFSNHTSNAVSPPSSSGGSGGGGSSGGGGGGGGGGSW